MVNSTNKYYSLLIPIHRSRFNKCSELAKEAQCFNGWLMHACMEFGLYYIFN